MNVSSPDINTAEIDEQRVKQARVMVVDDNPTNVLLLQKLLESSGYENVTGITDSREVKDTYAADPFDLVMLDIRMPHFDGFEVLEQLRSINPDDLPNVMVLTAQTDQETKLRALAAGARDFLHKPFDQIEVLTRIGNMIEVHLLHKQIRQQNLILDQKVKERTRELEETRLEIVRRLGRAAEYKDNETGQHVIRVSKVAELLGRSVGLSERDCNLILNASPMHDIGKIGIPDSVLLKPGKLDPDEWKIMMTHTTIGVEILGDHDSELMEMTRQVALTHHEKWDGSGYPNGLKGEDIPIAGRITALSDVFDALLSERPYKKPWTLDETINLIKEQSGKHFDPTLVEKMLELMPEILAIREQYEDDPEAMQSLEEKSEWANRHSK